MRRVCTCRLQFLPSRRMQRTNPRRLIYERADILVHPYCLREVTYERYCCVLNVTAREFVLARERVALVDEDQIYYFLVYVCFLNDIV